MRNGLVLAALISFTYCFPGAAAARALDQSLSVSVTGAGHVTSSPAGIKCPGTCSASFKDGEAVTLSAAADSGWSFSGWSGDCSGTKSCTLKMDGKHGVGASFKQQPGPPPAPPGFQVSTASPATGDRVTFDASSLKAVDHEWDLNGDGVFERHTHRQPSLAIAYGQPGTYAVTLRTTDAAGATAVYQHQVVVTGQPQAQCGVYCNVTFPPPAPEPGCLPGVSYGVVVAQGVCLRRRGAQYVTDVAVRVNGVDLYPTNGALIVFDPAAFTIANEGGLVTAQVGETQIYVGPLSWSGLSGTRATVVNLDAADAPGVSFEDFQVTARIHVDLISDGSAELGTDMVLPDILGDVAAHVLLHTDNADGLRLSALHIHLPTGWLSDKIPIQNLDLDYDEAENSWGGGLTIQLPAFDYQVGGTFGIVNGLFDHASVELGNIDTHIADGVYLQAIRANVQATPFGFGGGITLSYGPKIRDVDLISGDGDFHIAFSDPAVLNFTGALTVLSLIQIGDAYTTYSTDGNLHFGGELHRTWAPGVSMRAGMSGWVEGSRAWGMEGHGSLCLGACFGADVVTSDAGLATCGHLGIASIGFSYGWATRAVQLLGPACDLGPFRTGTSPHPAYFAAAGRVVTLPKGLPVTAFAVRGRGAPPLVTLRGPGGVRVETPVTADGAKTGRTLVFKSTQDDTTYLVVASPPGGTWQIVAAAGSAPIVSLRNAAGLPKPSVSADVRGTGRQRVLEYRVKPLAGQRVVFVERAARAARQIGAASGASGSIPFAPAPGPAGARRIVAVVTQNGRPRATLTVAGYSAPGPLPVGRPGKLALHRTKTALTIAWKAAPRAAAYRVDVRSSDGRHLRPYLAGGTRSYAVPRVAPGDRVTVTVVGVSRAGRAGPARSAVSKAAAR